MVADEGKMLPELRHDLFGLNENRKFYTVSAAFKSIPSNC